MTLYSRDLLNIAQQLNSVSKDNASALGEKIEAFTEATDRTNQLKTVELILIYGAEAVRDALENVALTSEGVKITIPEKKVSPVLDMKPQS